MLRIEVGDDMSVLPNSFLNSIKKQYGEDISLDLIKSLSVKKDDIQYLDQIPNLINVSLESFPSVNLDDLLLLNKKVPYLKSLTITEQSALFEVDFSVFPKLSEIRLFRNDNLTKISGIEYIQKLEVLGNRSIMDYDSIYYLLSRDCELTLDLSFYYIFLKMLYDNKQSVVLLEKVNWIENGGYKKQFQFPYKSYHLSDVTNMIQLICSRYVFKQDSDLVKFSVLYKWYLDNIRFENVSEKNDEEISSYHVLNYSLGKRVSYANTFCLMLSYVGIDARVVYSIDTLDSIGNFDGQKVYSVLGASDYALIRVVIDGKTYYVDIAWDAYLKEFKKLDFNRIYLCSKEEIKKNHNIIGEGNVINSSSYHGDDADDILERIERRNHNVDVILNEIDADDPSIEGKKVSIEYSRNRISELKEKAIQLDPLSEEYKMIQKDIIHLEVDNKEDVRKLNTFIENKNKAVIKYTDFIMNSYYTDDYETKYEYGLLSEYLFDLIKIVCHKKNS